MADPARARKVADRIKVIVAEYLEHRLKDERLGFVTITDVRVTGDLQHASIFYTVFGGEAERADTAAALEAARGKIRTAVGKGTGIRLTPSIEFIPDAIPEGAAHLEDLLVQAKQRDAELAAAVPRPGAGPQIPADFLLDGLPVKGLPGTLTLLHDAGFEDREAIAWLYRDQELPGRPIDALRENRGTEVRRRAQALAF